MQIAGGSRLNVTKGLLLPKLAAPVENLLVTGYLFGI